MDIDDATAKPPDRMKRRGVGCKCCFTFCMVIGIVILTVVIGFFLVTIGMGLYEGYKFAKAPHLHMYSPEPIEGQYAGARVWPLVDMDTRFDVGVTIWAVEKPINVSRHQVSFNLSQQVLRRTIDVELFSGVVMHNLSMRSKHQEVDIPYTLPLNFTKGPYVGSVDEADSRLDPMGVRAVVTLLPTDPSFLHDLTNMSSIFPSNFTLPLLGQNIISTGCAGEAGSVTRQAIEDMAVSIPLIALSENAASFLDRLVGKPTTTDALNTATDDDDISLETVESNIATQEDNPDDIQRQAWSKLQPPQYYRYLRTRFVIIMACTNSSSNTYIVKETRPFDYIKFIQKHTQLRKWAHVNSTTAVASRLSLKHMYNELGHWQSRFDMIRNGTVGEQAYPPYIGWVKDLHGKRLLLDIGNDTHPGPTSLNVTYTFGFSPLSALRTHGTHLESAVLHNQTVKADHEMSFRELMYLGLAVGQPVSGTHPWRIAVQIAFSMVSKIAAWVLEIIYWYTRGTSAGISAAAAWLRLAYPPSTAITVWLMMEGGSVRIFVIVAGLLTTMIVPILQLRVVFPYALGKENGRWGIRHWRWSHRERLTKRRDVTWRIALGVFAALSVANFVLDHYEAWLLAMPEYQTLKLEGLLSDSDDYLTKVRHSFYSAIANSTETASSLCQIIVNMRCGSFAGNYALGAYVNLFHRLVEIAAHGSILGTDHEFQGLHSNEMIFVVLDMVLAYQAATLPRVEQVVPETDEE